MALLLRLAGDRTDPATPVGESAEAALPLLPRDAPVPPVAVAVADPLKPRKLSKVPRDGCWLATPPLLPCALKSGAWLALPAAKAPLVAWLLPWSLRNLKKGSLLLAP